MPQPSNSRSFWTQLHPDQAVHQHQGLQGLFMGKDWLGLAGVTSIFHQFTSLHLSPLHFLGIRKNIWAALVLYLGPSRRLCSDISCFSPQKHLNCLKVPKNLRTFEDTHHSTNGIRTPAFTLRQVGCQLTRVPGAQFTALEAETWCSLWWSDSGSWQLCWGCSIWNCVLGPLGLGFCYDWAPSWENLGYPDWACHEATASIDGDLDPQNHSRNVKFYQWAQ